MERKKSKSLALVKHSIDPYQILLQFIQNDIIKEGKMKKKSLVNRFVYYSNEEISTSDKKEMYADKSIDDDLYSYFEMDKKTYQHLEEGYKEIWPCTFMILDKILESNRLSKIIEDGLGSFPNSINAKKEMKKYREKKKNRE